MAKPDAQGSELKRILLASRRAFFSVGLFSFIINLIMFVPAIFMMQLYERVLMSRNETTLLVISLIAVGLYALMGLLEMSRSLVLVRVSARLDVDLNRRIFTTTFEQRLRAGGGNPTQALSDMTNLRQFLTGSGLFAFFDAPWTPLFIFVIWALNPYLGMFALGGAVLLFGLAWITEAATRKPLADSNAHAAASVNFVNGNLRNAEAIEAMGMLDNLFARWSGHQRKMLALQAKASERSSVISSITRFARVSLQSLTLAVGAWLAIKGELTPGAMIAASILMGRALAPVEQAIGMWKQMVSARSAYQRLSKLLADFPAREPGMPLPPPTGKLVIENLVAGAAGRPDPILKGIQCSIEAGEAIGVIGPSAAGKSTLTRLIVGVWAPLSGKVRLDGADVYTWNKAELGPYIGYLPQDIELFDGTVAENIARFGKVDPEKVVSAAALAGVHEIVLKLPKGYDTPIGEGGSVLSGGQRQRIGLARALYGMPPLIVLDEPSASMDDAGAMALGKALQSLKQAGRTIILVTHSPPMLAFTDKLLLLVDGAMQAFGPRDQVLAALGKPPAATRPPQQAAPPSAAPPSAAPVPAPAQRQDAEPAGAPEAPKGAASAGVAQSLAPAAAAAAAASVSDDLAATVADKDTALDLDFDIEMEDLEMADLDLDDVEKAMAEESG